MREFQILLDQLRKSNEFKDNKVFELLKTIPFILGVDPAVDFAVVTSIKTGCGTHLFGAQKDTAVRLYESLTNLAKLDRSEIDAFVQCVNGQKLMDTPIMMDVLPVITAQLIGYRLASNSCRGIPVDTTLFFRRIPAGTTHMKSRFMEIEAHTTDKESKYMRLEIGCPSTLMEFYTACNPSDEFISTARRQLESILLP